MRLKIENILQNFRGNEISSVLIRGASGSMIVKMAGALIALGTQVLLARLLGTEEYGWYVYILAWIQILLIFSVLGFDSVVVKFTAQYVALEQWSLLRGLMSKGTLLVLASSSIVTVVAMGVVLAVNDNWPAQRSIAAYLGLLLVPVLSLTLMRHGSLLGLQKVIKAALPDVIVRPMALALFAIVLAFVFDSEINASMAMGFNLASALLAFSLGAYLLKISLPVQIFQVESRTELKKWLGLAFPMLFMSGMYMILAKTDIIMIGLLSDTDDAGIYSVTGTLTTVVGFGLVSANTIVAPLIAKYYSQNKMELLQQIVTLAVRGVTVFTVVATVVLILFGKHLLALFGVDFVEGYNAMLILLVGINISALVGSVGFLMVFTGHQNKAAMIVAASAAINVLANYFLIPLYGIEGAAIATSFSTIFWNLWMVTYVIRRLKINPTVF